MDLNTFIKQMADQFDNSSDIEFKAETIFKEIDEYSSLTALNIISMIDDEYDVYLKGDDIRNSNTIEELFERIKQRIG
jgi:acyl carrier protein